MKKSILVLMMFIICMIFASCTYTDNINFVLDYNEEERNCILMNVSDEDYTDLVITVVLHGADGLEKEVKHEIGELKSGEQTIFDVTEVSESTEINNVSLRSYDYYVDVVGNILIGILVILLILVFIVAICAIIS